jgi:hypothetical protein
MIMQQQQRQPKYLPSQQVIRQECQRFQRNWNERQRRNRRVARGLEVHAPVYFVRRVNRKNEIVFEAEL